MKKIKYVNRIIILISLPHWYEIIYSAIEVMTILSYESLNIKIFQSKWDIQNLSCLDFFLCNRHMWYLLSYISCTFWKWHSGFLYGKLFFSSLIQFSQVLSHLRNVNRISIGSRWLSFLGIWTLSKVNAKTVSKIGTYSCTLFLIIHLFSLPTKLPLLSLDQL